MTVVFVHSQLHHTKWKRFQCHLSLFRMSKRLFKFLMSVFVSIWKEAHHFELCIIIIKLNDASGGSNKRSDIKIRNY